MSREEKFGIVAIFIVLLVGGLTIYGIAYQPDVPILTALLGILGATGITSGLVYVLVNRYIR